MTANKTGGICMPCYNTKKHAEREIYILENKKDVDLFKGLSDRAEIIIIMHQKHPSDPLVNYVPYPIPIEDIYSQLSKHEEKHLIAYVERQLLLNNVDVVESIGLELAAFRGADLSIVHKTMLETHEYYPCQLFKNANSETVNTLLSRLETDDVERGNILLSLAWAGTPAVILKFSEWALNPPAWSKDLYIPVHEYAKDAGWILANDLKKRTLYLDKCYSLIPNTGSINDEFLNTCVISEKSCHWCNRKLTHLLEINLKNTLYDFLSISGERLVIATCDTCSSYSDSIFMDITNNGNAEWSKYNKKPGYLPEDSADWEYMPTNCLNISNKPRAVDYAANMFLPTTFSQIGGMPTWIQDFAYPDCPKCNETMVFLAQISNEDIVEYGEGIFYNYICPMCNITATNYQQT